MKDKCIICGKLNPDKHHWKTRKSGGTDEVHNLMSLCRFHHTEVHKIGASTFSEKYRIVKNWLLSHGWEYNELLKKWRR